MIKRKILKACIIAFSAVFLHTGLVYANAENKGWKQENNNWLYFDEAGKKLTGWQMIQGDWYFLNKATGVMEIGWIKTESGGWFFLNPVSDGKKGKMLTGWQWVDGYCYYLNPMNDKDYGKMYSDGKTPDGYMVDGQGRWIDASGNVQFVEKKGILTSSNSVSDKKTSKNKVASSGSSGGGSSSRGRRGGSGGSSNRGGGSGTGNVTNPDTGNTAGNTENPNTGNNVGNTENPNTGNNAGNAENPNTGNNAGNTENPNTGNNVGNTENPNTGNNAGNTENPNIGNNAGNAENPNTGNNAGNTENPNTGNNAGNAENPNTGNNTGSTEDSNGGADTGEGNVSGEDNNVNRKKTVQSVEQPESISVEYGKPKSEIWDMLPRQALVELDDESIMYLDIREWTGEVNAYSPGEYVLNAVCEFPEDIQEEDLVIRITVIVRAKPQRPKAVADKAEYYYSQNPIIQIQGIDNIDKENLSVVWNKEYFDRDLRVDDEYTYDENSKSITLNTHAILKVDSRELSSPRSIDITVKVGELSLPMLTVSYKASKRVYVYPLEHSDLERNQAAKVEIIGLEREDYTALELFNNDTKLEGITITDEVEDGESSTFLNIPFEVVADKLDSLGKVIITGRLENVKDFTFTLIYVSNEDETNLKQLDADVLEYRDEGRTPEGYPIYPYNEDTTMRVEIRDSELTKDFIENNTQIQIQSQGKDKFTAPTPNDDDFIGKWRVETGAGKFTIKIPVDQSRGEINYRRNSDGTRPYTDLFVKIKGYEMKELRLVIMP